MRGGFVIALDVRPLLAGEERLRGIHLGRAQQLAIGPLREIHRLHAEQMGHLRQRPVAPGRLVQKLGFGKQMAGLTNLVRERRTAFDVRNFGSIRSVVAARDTLAEIVRTAKARPTRLCKKRTGELKGSAGMVQLPCRVPWRSARRNCPLGTGRFLVTSGPWRSPRQLPSIPVRQRAAPPTFGVRSPVPDYELLRRIGSGSYGDVWLARNVLGQFRAR